MLCSGFACGLQQDPGMLLAGALELLQRGQLSADHWDWERGAGFRFNRDEDAQEESAANSSTRSPSG